MARHIGDLRLSHRAFQIALYTAVCAVPAYCQSSSKPADTEPKPEVSASQGAQETKQPIAVEKEQEPFIPASTEKSREAEIEANARKLYQLSAELRAEVAKTYKDSLSLSVIKKAQEVEKLAKSLKALMNEEAAAYKH